jgi:hypothetical protein
VIVPGIIASEWRAGSLVAANFADVVFQSTWDGTNGGTNAVDESSVKAPLTFNGTVLTNTQHLFDAATSLRCDSLTDYVSAPANPLYDIGVTDFTIEFFVRIPSFVSGSQLCGVWQNDENNAVNQWRVVADSTRMRVQAKMGGSIAQWSYAHGMLLDTWYYVVWCRYAGRLRAFQGELGGTATMKFSANMIGPFTALSGVPLYIGGCPGGSTIQNGSNAFFQHMRITRAAWYRTDDSFPVPDHKFNFGNLLPATVSVPDIFYLTKVNEGFVNPPLFAPADIFAAPTVLRSPSFVNSTATDIGNSTSAPVPMVGSRVNGNMLIALLVRNSETAGGIVVQTGGAGWNSSAPSTGSGGSIALWMWRMVDGTELAPTFAWLAGTSAPWQTRMFQFTGTAVPGVTGFAIGNVLQNAGASANLLVNGGVGLTTVAPLSSVVALTALAGSNQIIPLPSGYLGAGAGFNDTIGSNQASIQHQGAGGSVSGPVNLAIASAFWHGFMIELRRPN